MVITTCLFTWSRTMLNVLPTSNKAVQDHENLTCRKHELLCSRRREQSLQRTHRGVGAERTLLRRCLHRQSPATGSARTKANRGEGRGPGGTRRHTNFCFRNPTRTVASNGAGHSYLRPGLDAHLRAWCAASDQCP